MSTHKHAVPIPKDQTQSVVCPGGDGHQTGGALKKHQSTNVLIRAAVVATIAAAMTGGLISVLRADDTKPAAATATTTTTDTNAAASAARPVEPVKKPKKLTGSELYAINCNRCHAERYPTEFNSAQWQTILTHMRVRANLPAKQAREILKYLQEESGN